MNDFFPFKKEIILNVKNFNILHDNLTNVLEKDDINDFLIIDLIAKTQKDKNKTEDDLREFKKKNS